MSEMVPLQVWVETEFADELMRKKIMEVAFRGVHARFKNFEKFRVDGLVPSGDQVVQRASNAILKKINKNHNVDMRYIRNYMNKIQGNLGDLSSITKNISVQTAEIYKMTNVVRNLGYLNVGLSLVNTAIDLTGFVIVSGKINELGTELRALSEQVNKIATVQKNEKLADFNKLLLNSNSMIGKIKDKDEIDQDELEKLIINLKGYLSEMIDNMYSDAIDKEIVLKMIFTMMPVYTVLVCAFTKEYFFKKGCLPVNYDAFCSLYDEICNKQFMDYMKEYYFLECKMHCVDITDIINAEYLVAINGKVQIEDVVTILQACKSRQKVQQYEQAVDAYTVELTRQAV